MQLQVDLGIERGQAFAHISHWALCFHSNKACANLPIVHH